MHSLRRLGLVLGFCLLTGLSLAAQSESNPVSLGVSIGPTFPLSGGTVLADNGQATSFNWGFYVNIPLVYALDLMPSAELYRFGSQSATDVDLAFKFLVPINSVSLYAGFAPGLTAISQSLDPHVEGILGFSVKLVSNLSAFAQGKYVYIFDNAGSVKVLHVNTGLLLAF